MKRIYVIGSIALAALLIVLLFVLLQPREASLLLINGVVHTVNEKTPAAQAIAVVGDRIVAVGTTNDVMSAYRTERVIDLKGKPVFPGFVDAHAHVEGLGALLRNLSLVGTASVREIQERVRERAQQTPRGEWIRGRGWDQNRWERKEFPTRRDLDAAAPENPVSLTRIDGHAVWVNTRALELAGVDRTRKDPDGGRIIRDAAGNPTGVFVDNAIDMLNAALPPPSGTERKDAIRAAIRRCTSNGIVAVHDMGVDLEGIALYKELMQEGDVPIRIYAAIDGPGKTWNQYVGSGPEVNTFGGHLTVRALKLYADGALGSRGAALIAPYSDDPGNRGLTVTSADDLRKASLEALDGGFQVCVHAIGDRANHIVLNVFEQVLKQRGSLGKDVRFRIEHAQVLDSSDVHRFHALRVLPVMQPTHCTSDMEWAENRLGPKRILGAYAWRTLLKDGNIVPAGSDAPVEDPNPLFGIYAAITRQDHNGWPPDGWYPAQRMTRDEALKAFTLWAAFSAFQEKEAGSIEPGKWADLVVLSDDIMVVEPREILTTSVEMTIVAGQIVYSAGSMLAEAPGRAHRHPLSQREIPHGEE